MNIFSVGCSFTEGQGIGGREHSYSKHLSKKLDAYHFNFGEAGHSNKYIFRKSIELLKKWNKNDLLIIQWTNPFRDEIASNEGFLFYPPFANFVSLGFLYGKNPISELKKMGIEDKDEYDKKILKEKENYLIEAFNINNDLLIIKKWIDNNEPIAVAISIFSNFVSITTKITGKVGMPTKDDKFLGGHAVVICGYDDNTRELILRNSWGTYWGDRGYFYLPYDYLKFCGDLWIITKSKFNNS